MKPTYKLFLVALVVAFSACKSGIEKRLSADLTANPSTAFERAQNAIINHCIKNKIDAQRSESGVYYNIEAPGVGATANDSSWIVMHYDATYLSGNKHSSSREGGKPVTLALSSELKGLQEVFSAFKVGGKGKFIMPAELAFGKSIPDPMKDSALIFNIDFLEIFDEKAQAKKDDEAIQKYVADNKLTTQKTAKGIYYVIEKEGTGAAPAENAEVEVHYKGTLLDGKQFDSSYDRKETAKFGLGQVIPGWRQAIPLLKVGGKGKFIIPSGLAYGPRGNTNIEPNSVLVFDVELVSIYDANEQAQKDDQAIQAYLKAKKLTAEKTPTGIYYIIEKQGTGDNPTPASTVEVHYKGTLLNGTEFDSSYKRNEKAKFPLSNVIMGWQQGIPLLKAGGKGKLFIPSALAYGRAGSPPNIPANSPLIFDVELFSIEN